MAGDELIAALVLNTAGTMFDSPNPTRQNPAIAEIGEEKATTSNSPTAATPAPSMMICIRPAIRTA